VSELAGGLRDAGIGEGDVVGLIAPNGAEWIEAFLAVLRVGAVAMPLAEQLGSEELGRILAHSGARHAIVSARHARRLESFVEELGLDLLLVKAEGPLERAEPPPDARWLDDLAGGDGAGLPPLEPGQVAALLYTSGTTGTPKGVPLSHRNLCTNVEALLQAELASPADRVLLPLPLFHTYPLTVGLLAPLAVGAAIVLPAGITGPAIMHALKDSRATIMIAVPRLYEAMLDGIRRRLRERGLIGRAFERLLELSVGVRRRTGWRLGALLLGPLRRQVGPDLRLLASGGARLEPDVAYRLEALGFEVLTGYGLTETAPILTFNPPGRARLETTGLPVAGVELRIDAAEGAEANQGEIVARGPNVFRGYFENPEATAESFTADGFFRTGDLGYVDDDGYLRIGGRSKELIVLSGGKNIFPDEVEKVYGASGLIKEMAVLEQDGRLVGLFVPEQDSLQDARPEELRQQVRREVERLSPQLPSYARLGDLAVTARALPRTQIGKLKRHELPAIFEQAKAGDLAEDQAVELSEADQGLIDTPPAGDVWAWLNERFEGRRLTPDSSPQLDLGLDSFDWMSLTMELEERFGVRLSEEALARVATLRDLLGEVLEAAPGDTAAGPREPEGLEPEQERWLEPQGPALRALARVLFELNRIVMRVLFRLRTDGGERLPGSGPFLIAPNHVSYLDPFAIAAALSWAELQQTYWAGWTGLLFRGPLTRLFSRASHVIPVDPRRGLTSTLALGRGVLARDLVLVWFPEGQRSRDGRLQRFLPGAGWLIDKTGAAVVPAHISGAFEALPPGAWLPRPKRLEVRFGAPVTPQQLGAGLEGEARHKGMAERLRDAVAGLGAGA
jgi:long-chain acyl-CoA synthetase